VHAQFCQRLFDRRIIGMGNAGQRRGYQSQCDETFFHNVSFKKPPSRPWVMLLMKLSQALSSNVRINLGGGEIAVAKQHLDHT